MMMPLISPITAPMAHTIRITTKIGMVAISGNTLLAFSIDCNRVAAMTAARPTWRPAERSVPWVTISPAAILFPCRRYFL